MASITAKKIKGRTYYYLRECAWVDGRPKIVRTKYLGTAEAVAAALEGLSAPGGHVREEAPVLAFGAVAALYDLATRLGVVEIIDRHVPKQARGGPSVGTYLLLGALNRCVAPTSKAQLASWYEGTVLPRRVKVKPAQLSSQRFWDNMDRVSEEALIAIERELAVRTVESCDLDRACLFYDATNFITYVDTFNDRASLPQRGHSKDGRSNLRILGLALLVTSDFQVPLFHKLYPGNDHDAPTFRGVLSELVERYRLMADGTQGVTLVFDKGNNAKDTVEELADGPFHFVGSLVPTQHPDLLAVSKRRMRRLDEAVFPSEVRVHRTTKDVYGKKLTIVVTWNARFAETQAKTIEREAAARSAKLGKYQRYLLRWAREKGKGRRPTVAGTKKAVDKILTGRHMKELFEVAITKDPTSNLPVLRYHFDAAAYARLRSTLLGKTLIFTDNSSWTDEKIVLAYRGQHHVEGAFRQMKDPRHTPFRPSFHWTDQKLRVHAFCCVLALLLCSLLRRELSKAGHELSVNRMLDTLSSIDEVHVLLSSGRGRPRTKRIHSKLDPTARELFEALDLERWLR